MNRASAHLKITLLAAIAFLVLVDVASCRKYEGWGRPYECLEPGDTSANWRYHCFVDSNPNGDNYCCPGYKCNCKSGGIFSSVARGYDCDCEKDPNSGKGK